MQNVPMGGGTLALSHVAAIKQPLKPVFQALYLLLRLASPTCWMLQQPAASEVYVASLISVGKAWDFCLVWHLTFGMLQQ